jgi:hypothetical protein
MAQIARYEFVVVHKAASLFLLARNFEPYKAEARPMQRKFDSCV